MADISKITLPNGSSYDIKDATARAGKQNIRNGTISGNVNWDTLTTAGTYKIQNTTMTADYSAPVGEYQFGILIVFDSESGGENRIMQIYFPHQPRQNYMYTRMRNGNGWTKWIGLSKNADTVDGKHASDFAASSHTHSAYVNQNAFSNVVVGSTTVAADSATDTLTLVAGSNVTITPDATNDKITIASTNTWRGIQNNLTSDSTTESLSAAQGKALKALVDGKAASSHTHTTQSAEATNDANASYLRQIATGTAEATTTNCPNGCLYGQYS